MDSHFLKLSSADREREKRIANIWNAIDSEFDAGGATDEVLDRLRKEVSDCLYQRPPDLNRAERLTAQALLRISDNYPL